MFLSDTKRLQNTQAGHNANLIILFNQDRKIVRAIHDRIVGGDIPFSEFCSFCNQCWAETYGFALIDLTLKPFDGEYRSGFDLFYTPSTST